MKFQFDHDYHIHSRLSLCSSDPEQNNESILQYAKDEGLKEIVLTDHFWDEKIPKASDWYKKQGLEYIKQALPLPQDKDVRFLFGAETEFNKTHTVAMARETFDEFDFVIIPTTHLHMRGLTIAEEDYDAEDDTRSRLWVSRMDALLSLDLPFRKIGIAHLACRLVYPDQDFSQVLDAVDERELKRLFSKAALLGVGIELNAVDFRVDQRTAEQMKATYRIFGIAKEQGCKFYLGSDSHHPSGFVHAMECFERAVSELGLCEDDKFRPSCMQG